jgi:hypothetical protein
MSLGVFKPFRAPLAVTNVIKESSGLMSMTLVVESAFRPYARRHIRGWHQCPNLSAHCNSNSKVTVLVVININGLLRASHQNPTSGIPVRNLRVWLGVLEN